MSRQDQSSDDLRAESGKPRLSAIVLIYVREMRDQLRDRRTLFTIALLPIMLYPLVGTLLLQIAQFSQKHTTTICLVGSENIQGGPPLLKGDAFSEEYTDGSNNLTVVLRRADDVDEGETLQEATVQWVQDGSFDCVLIFPPSFVAPASEQGQTKRSVEVLYNVSSDESQIAMSRVTTILGKWRSAWVGQSLEASGIDMAMLEPFQWKDVDLSPERTREAAFWSKMLPFIMLVWAMTGAFYPAIDLVAGEKERGTLETLLCSPALRSEIVWGKLGAVASFSMLTAILNAGSMLVTSYFVVQRIGVGGAAIGA